MNNLKEYIIEKLKINKDLKDEHYELYYILKDWCEENLKDKYDLEDEKYKEVDDTYFIYLIIHGNKSNSSLMDIASKIQNEIYLNKEGDIMAFLDEDSKKILVFNH